MDELLETLHESPSLFTGVHYPVLLKAASDIKAGRIKTRDAAQYMVLSTSDHRLDGTFSDLNGTTFGA